MLLADLLGHLSHSRTCWVTSLIYKNMHIQDMERSNSLNTVGEQTILETSVLHSAFTGRHKKRDRTGEEFR
jgi:hypothetical protein